MVTAVALPVAGGALAARLAGQTKGSVGEPVAAGVAAAMMIFPGYALILSSRDDSSLATYWIGRGLLGLGVPLATTVADRLFRSARR
ncbi:MAG: hypothetical protein ACRELD_07555 [Longimicrobiales bacterium]